MNRSNTRVWAVIAAGLLAFILFVERNFRQPSLMPDRVLPGFSADAVTSISLLPAGQREIRAERTNGVWQLTKPISYPASAVAVGSLLAALENLAPAKYISAAELARNPGFHEQCGLDAPPIQLNIYDQSNRSRLLIGNHTPPGDQVYVEVPVLPGDYVVDADFMRFLPRTVTDWRDTALADLRGQAFDRLCISNAARAMEFERGATDHVWRMTKPIFARADNNRIADSLRMLQNVAVKDFVSDDPKADLETYGLQPPELELKLTRGTNSVMCLQFGRSPTNDAGLVYSLRCGANSVVTVASNSITPWMGPRDDYRDRRLVTFSDPVDQIEVFGDDHFTLRRQQDKSWRLTPQNFPVDSGLANQFLEQLRKLSISRFAREGVTEKDRRDYGLLAPLRKIVLNPGGGAGAPVGSGLHLVFGTNQENSVFALRDDEDSVYAVDASEFQMLPAASWRLRERRVWNFPVTQVARVAIRENGKQRQLERVGTNSWALAPGSQGILTDLDEAAIEETARELGELSAEQWLARNPGAEGRRNFQPDGYELSIELKDGGKRSLEIGHASGLDSPCAAVTLDGEKWILEMPPRLFFYLSNYLRIPAGAP